MSEESAELEKTWMIALQVWWAVVWRTVLVLFVIALLFQAVMLFQPLSLADQLLQQQLFLVALPPVWIWATRKTLNKNFFGFRLALVKLPEKKAKTKDSDAGKRAKKGQTKSDK